MEFFKRGHTRLNIVSVRRVVVIDFEIEIALLGVIRLKLTFEFFS